jgi:hypothetical protein
MLLRKNLQDLCFLCRLDTVKARLRQWHTQLGTWVVIQSMNLLVVRTRVRLRWLLVARCADCYVKKVLNPLSKLDWTPNLNLPRLGLLLLAVVTSLLVLAGG